MARWQGFYEELAHERYSSLLAYAIAFTGQRATAEDLVQEAMVRTFSAPRRLTSAQHAEMYVRRAIANIFVDDARRTAVFKRTEHRLASTEGHPDHGEAIDERDAITQALLTLSPQLRACIVLRYYDDLPVAEIAHHLKLATGTVKRYLHDGSAQLRELLGAEDPPEHLDDVAITTIDVTPHHGRR